MKQITMCWKTYQKELAEAQSQAMCAAWREALKYLRCLPEDPHVKSWIEEDDQDLSVIGKIIKQFCLEVCEIKKNQM